MSDGRRKIESREIWIQDRLKDFLKGEKGKEKKKEKKFTRFEESRRDLSKNFGSEDFIRRRIVHFSK